MQHDPSNDESAIEACIDALEEATTALSHHPPRALALALAVHLQAVLSVLRAREEFTAQEVRGWLEEIACGALGLDP